MNWSHTLLVAAILSAGGAIISRMIAKNAVHWVDESNANGWMMFFIIVTTISGALAAGLWR